MINMQVRIQFLGENGRDQTHTVGDLFKSLRFEHIPFFVEMLYVSIMSRRPEDNLQVFHENCVTGQLQGKKFSFYLN